MNTRQSQMPDLSAALESFQDALSNQQINPEPCELYENLYLLKDDADGRLRMTYARIVEGKVLGMVAYVPVEPVDSIPCFNVGYAVDAEDRRKGIGSEILEESLSEIENGLRHHGNGQYYIEAVISVENEASNKIARKHLSDTPKQIVCMYSGEDALQYFKLYTI
ncbi:MAG: GNAT family N-acetyltransferase [Opitutaceae bacterium]